MYVIVTLIMPAVQPVYEFMTTGSGDTACPSYLLVTLIWEILDMILNHQDDHLRHSVAS